MSNYPVSHKIAIINDIAAEGSVLWKMLNEKFDDYSEEAIKELFVSILNKDQNNNTRFNINRCVDYVNNAALCEGIDGKPKKYDVLHSCYMNTRQYNLHSFLFNPKED